jgi:thioredoxin-related protein
VTYRQTVVALLAAWTCLIPPTWAADDAPAIQWQPQIMEAWKSAQADNRPLLIYVSLEGCHYCRKMEQDTLRDPLVTRQVGEAFVAARADAQRDAAIVRRWNVEVYPSTVIIGLIRGYVAADELQGQLGTIARARAANRSN